MGGRCEAEDVRGGPTLTQGRYETGGRRKEAGGAAVSNGAARQGGHKAEAL